MVKCGVDLHCLSHLSSRNAHTPRLHQSSSTTPRVGCSSLKGPKSTAQERRPQREQRIWVAGTIEVHPERTRERCTCRRWLPLAFEYGVVFGHFPTPSATHWVRRRPRWQRASPVELQQNKFCASSGFDSVFRPALRRPTTGHPLHLSAPPQREKPTPDLKSDVWRLPVFCLPRSGLNQSSSWVRQSSLSPEVPAESAWAA